MFNNVQKILIKKALKMPRGMKILIVMLLDSLISIFSTWLGFNLAFNNIFYFNLEIVSLSLLGVIICIPVFYFYGLYRTIFRYSGFYTYKIIIKAFFVYTFIYTIILLELNIVNFPISFYIIQPMIMFILVNSSRLLIKVLVGLDNVVIKNKKSVIIYGTSPLGRELASNIKNNNEFHLSCFIDDNNNLWGGTIDGYKVFSPSEIEKLIEKKNVKKLWLALPNMVNSKRQEIINNLKKLPIHVQTLPRYLDLVNDKVHLQDLRELNIDELLGREVIKPDNILFQKCILNKCVLITGAGGSIGSELCQQIFNCNPKKIILIDNSEIALYKILNKLEAIKSTKTMSNDTLIIPLLCNVLEKKSINDIFKTWKPNTIYHCAAYKHVPLVEQNIIAGTQNNVMGTLICAELAVKYKVEHFVLISSDKAVRPTNVMGASKRLAEIVIQSISKQTDKQDICFSIVRFGNVIGSTGSVVPLFRKQIESGGPITLTNKKVTRFFMTIQEAAQLVIQAGAMSNGGEVFLLDMGKPMLIADLAKKMIEASGLSIKNENNPSGDIEIKITGLRAGEKLYEELLIGNNSESTEHPRIFMAFEIFPTEEKFIILINKLMDAFKSRNINMIIDLLIANVNGYMPSENIKKINSKN